jgi:hypothetical protein
MNNGKNPITLPIFAAGVAAQIGCLLIITVGGALLLGFLLSELFGGNRIFLLITILASVPLNLWVIYRYTIYQSKRLQSSQPHSASPTQGEMQTTSRQKEDTIGHD